MALDDKLDQMNLPLANGNEELSIISENYFKPLFDVKKFVIRAEQERDKGIDFQIEVKIKNRFTNFRFAIQLKATDSKDTNNDGSISLQLDTSNINYLLNNPMPAFYVLFFKETSTFYFESINGFAKVLYEKNPDWNLQPTHTLRFKKRLDANGLDEMYQMTLEKGKFQRIVNEKTALYSSSLNKGDKILVDANLNVSDDTEIRKFIEEVGILIVNEGKWKEIILYHKTASGNIATSAKYNLVLGIANYYNGNLIDAISFFKAASSLKTDLDEDLQNHLKYFQITAKYSVGIIPKEEYVNRMVELENTNNIGLYVKLEKAKQEYVESLKFNPDESHENYVSEVLSIINDPKADESIRLNAKCDLILFEGFKNNIDYLKSVSMLNALEVEIGPNLKMRMASVSNLIEAREKWAKTVQEYINEAIDSKNYLAYFNVIVNEAKVMYEFEVYRSLIFVVQELPGFPKPEIPDNKHIFKAMLDKVTNAYNYFNQIGFIENSVASLCTKYEIAHYIKDFENAKKILDELENIIEVYDLTEQKKKLQFLKENGTTHEKFKAFIDKIFEEDDINRKELEELEREMIKMDENESNIVVKPVEDNYQILLFPIGYFEFPKVKKEQVYEILNINDQARKVFDQMLGIVIPIANINYNPILTEGYIDKRSGIAGIDSFRNVFRIRKAFYENKFYRFEPAFE